MLLIIFLKKTCLIIGFGRFFQVKCGGSICQWEGRITASPHQEALGPLGLQAKSTGENKMCLTPLLSKALPL